MTLKELLNGGKDLFTKLIMSLAASALVAGAGALWQVTNNFSARETRVASARDFISKELLSLHTRDGVIEDRLRTNDERTQRNEAYIDELRRRLRKAGKGN